MNRNYDSVKLIALTVMSNSFHQSQVCTEVPDEQCEDKDIKVPKQEKEHKKKCLLEGEASLPPTPAPSYPSPLQVTAPLMQQHKHGDV